MLKDRDLLIFGMDWAWFPSVMERIAEHLLPFNRILWVGSVSMRRPRIKAYDAHRIARRLGSLLLPGPRNRNGIEPTAEVNPFVIPFYDTPGVKSINDAMLRNTLRPRIKELDFRDFMILSATPMVVDILGTLGESSSHYFCLDDYSCYDGAYRSIGQLEQRMLKKVDSFFTLSEPLMQTRKARSGENFYLPMGVDTDMFSPSVEPLPSPLGSLKKPIVGFFGQIGSYVDIDLIVRCANMYPHASFVVIGRPHVDVSIFKQASNISFLGEIPYQDMPRYARGFDVGLNPRVLNQLSLAMNPLKILEYMALGMPVVSTDLPAVRKFEGLVSIAGSRDHFVELVGDALRDTDSEKRKERRAIAQQFSWRFIAESVSEVLERTDSAKRVRSEPQPTIV